ncbi:MAG: glycoside hydrolase family 31 protein [Verrucomicrobiae bacterium]|nr:glycoside hydrolase family 31 protein [Verrucomicrobiae bacterium]
MKSGKTRKAHKVLAFGLVFLGGVCGVSQAMPASNAVVVGSVRVQMLSRTLVRLESAGAEGFEDRNTFHVVNRNWPGTTYSSNLVSGMVVITTANYAVHVPPGAASLTGTYVADPAGQVLYQFNGTLSNNVWLPGPSDNPKVLSFADMPRLIPPAWELTPAPAGAALASTSGWDTNNDAPDIYVFVPNGSYAQMRGDFLKLTGPTEMVPLYALGLWDSRYYNYSEATALQEIADNRARQIPQDVMVIDTGWRQNASTGYQPNTSLFPNLPRFFSEAHTNNVHVTFNDHPQPVASAALDPAEVTYRYTNLTQLLGQGLDVWWYDRNWNVSLLSPSPNLRHEVWAMMVYHDATQATNAPLRSLMMANIDGIDNGIRNNPPDVATHRYSIQWTGDIEPTMAYLTYAIQNAVHSGVQSLFPYESDDLGGHRSDPGPGDYIRWIEYGALSPIYRPHCTLNLMRMPWTFGPEAEWTARRLINLRYRLLPELYAAARKNYDTGEPLLRRLDLDYPQYPQAKQENQYLLGHSILVAPVTQGGMSTVPSAWLTTANGQAGLTASYFSNTNLAGTAALTRVDANIDFNWGTGSPGGSVGSDNFSARWTGNLTVPLSVGDVTLAATSDDGVRVWVDNQLCIGNWGPNDSVITESTATIKAGQTHQLRVEYLELAGNAIVSLKWRGASSQQSVWIPPGNWINAWSGALLKGPLTILENTPLEHIPLYLRSGSIFALAPPMQYTGQMPWDPVTLDVYPSTTEADSTSLYEDDTLTTAYQQGQFRTTAISTWANDANKTVSVSIGAAAGSFANAPAQRSWVARLRRPPGWSADLAPVAVTLNGNAIGPIVRRVGNASAMPLGAENGAPDADVFEVTVPATPVLAGNLLVATFASVTSPWICSDIGAVGANGNVVEGASTCSNSAWVVRGGGAGIGGTNDGFHFLYQPCLTNAQMTVQVLNQSSANPLAAAGIMISETLNASARNVLLGLVPGQQLIFQNRSTAGGSGQVSASTSLATPCWLRLVRNGNVFTSYSSLNNTTWTLLNSVTIPGFNPQAYIGLAVTAGIANAGSLATNSSGTAIIGACPEMLGGVYCVDDTNRNVAVFGSLALNTSASISTVPNQTTAQSTPTPAIPFTVGSTSANPLTISVNSSDTNLLPVANIIVTGTGGTRWVTLTPGRGISGTCTVTLTVSDGIGTASTQLTLTVRPLTDVLLSEDFSNYPAGNLPGQSYLGSGFAANGSWIGLNSSFSANVADAGVLAYPGLVSPLVASAGGKVTVKGDGSDVGAFPDLSTNGPFAAAGLLDSASGTIGGGNVTGTLYLSFLVRAHFANGNNAYGGLHLSRGDDTTGVLIGNSWIASAFSIYYAPTDSSFDLVNNNGGGGYLFVDTNTHLAVARINYAPGGDTLTAWLDPDTGQDENSQDSATTYLGTLSGDLSFNRFFLRGGNSSKQFDYGEIRFGTDWRSVLPAVGMSITSLISLRGAALLSDRSFNLSFSGPIAQSYTIWASTNLTVPLQNWANLGGGTFSFDPANFTDLNAMNLQSRFYRITSP